MRLVTKWCPNCNYTLQKKQNDSTSGSIQIGIPYIKCPNCGAVLIKPNVKEVNMLTKYDYFKIIIRGIFSILLLVLISNIFIFGILGLITNSFNYSVIIVIEIILLLLFSRRFYNTFKKELNMSAERLKDQKYAQIVNEIKKEFYN